MKSNNSVNKNNNAYDNDYIPYIIKWGRRTNLLGVLLAFGPAFVVTVIFGINPTVGVVLAGSITIWSISGIFWVVEPVSYFPVLGIPGTYMSFISGNIGNLRLPASVAALESSGIEPGTEKGTVIATLGVAVSIMVNIVMLTVGVVLGASVLSRLPAGFVTALNNILPALFGAMLGQQFMVRPKIGIVAVILAGIMTALLKFGFLAFLPGFPSYAVIIVSVFGSILIGKQIYKDDFEEETEEK
jgi:hypothetical protein